MRDQSTPNIDMVAFDENIVRQDCRKLQWLVERRFCTSGFEVVKRKRHQIIFGIRGQISIRLVAECFSAKALTGTAYQGTAKTNE